MDSTRDIAFLKDAELTQFFQRPIKIAEYSWTPLTPLFQRFDPWALFWNDPRNIEKIKHYYLLKCTMHIKILINGNAFYYGRAIAAYEPLNNADNTSAGRNRTWVNADFVRGSQRMHVYLNPTTSLGGSMELPFFWPENALSIPDEDWSQMGDIVLASLNDLQHANGATEPLSIAVMAWAENVSYSIPTRSTPSLPLTTPNAGKMGDEYNEPIISRPASAVARIAGALSNVPVIAPFARATEIGAGAIAKVAKIFGFSSPTNLEYSPMIPLPKHSFAVTDIQNLTNKVTVDSKQEITLDPRTTGIQEDDELPIASIAGRESFLTTFTWDTTQDVETLLFNSRVDPGLKVINGDEFHFTAAAFAALPFQYWRGTMRYRFQIVCSEYHKGRIRLVYDPDTGSDLSAYNTHYTTVHDISTEKDFTIDIGWGQKTPYRQSLKFETGSYFGSSPIESVESDIGNGVLSVHILNKLTSPSDAGVNVSVNVFVSMLDDFEVGAPSDDISVVRFRPEPPEATVLTTPNSGTIDGDMDCCDTPVTDPPLLDNLADTNVEDPDVTKVFFGEVIGSFRQLLKRSYRAETSTLPLSSTTPTVQNVSRGSFPIYGGQLPAASYPTESMVTEFDDGRYFVPVETTMMNYLGRAFLGWRGSTRWTIDASSYGDRGLIGSNSLSVSLSRNTSFTNRNVVTPLTNSNAPDFSSIVMQAERGADTHGMMLCNTHINPILNVEIPYYLNKRFSYTAQDDEFISSVEGPPYNISSIFPESNSGNEDITLIRTFVSAGEDFNLFFFNGLPPVYFEPFYPVDAGPPGQ